MRRRGGAGRYQVGESPPFTPPIPVSASPGWSAEEKRTPACKTPGTSIQVLEFIRQRGGRLRAAPCRLWLDGQTLYWSKQNRSGCQWLGTKRLDVRTQIHSCQLGPPGSTLFRGRVPTDEQAVLPWELVSIQACDRQRCKGATFGFAIPGPRTALNLIFAMQAVACKKSLGWGKALWTLARMRCAAVAASMLLHRHVAPSLHRSLAACTLTACFQGPTSGIAEWAIKLDRGGGGPLARRREEQQRPKCGGCFP